MSPFDVAYVRRQFPALKRMVDGQPAAYLDGPGGTQTPQRVIDAVVDYLANHNCNVHGAFATSRGDRRRPAGGARGRRRPPGL